MGNLAKNLLAELAGPRMIWTAQRPLALARMQISFGALLTAPLKLLNLRYVASDENVVVVVSTHPATPPTA